MHTPGVLKPEAKTPIEELLAAEEQSAAQAAAEKAKKQKQKAKKQLQKQEEQQQHQQHEQQQEQQALDAQQQHQLLTAKHAADAQAPVLQKLQPNGTAPALIFDATEMVDAGQPLAVMQAADPSSVVASSLTSRQLGNAGRRQTPEADEAQQQQTLQACHAAVTTSCRTYSAVH